MRASRSILLVLLAACDASDGITVLVDLRTDLAPGDEFLAVRTEIGAAIEERPALMGQSYLDGRRVAEIGGLAPGRTSIRVVLLDASGGLVTEQHVALDLTGDAGVTIVVSRDCLGVRCPAAGEPPDREVCLGGVCVTPECAGPLAEGCPADECATDSECGAAPCSAGRCAHGVCLSALDDSLCAPGERCDPAGCVPISSTDGGVDAGASDGGATFDLVVSSATDALGPGDTADLTITTSGTAGLEVLVRFDVPAFTTPSAPGFACTIPSPRADVTDGFDRADGSVLGSAPTGQAWTALFGPAAGIADNALAFRSMSYSVASIRAPGRSEGRLAVTFTDPGDEAWLVGAIDDPVTLVRLGHCCGATRYFLENVVDGHVVAFEALSELRPPLAPSPGDRLELRIEPGGRILALVNGELLFEAVHPEGEGREPVGVSGLERGGGARLDDFSWGAEPDPIRCSRTSVLSGDPNEVVVSITLARTLPSRLVELPLVFTAEAGGTSIERRVELAILR
jgi:hypothetical protein